MIINFENFYNSNIIIINKDVFIRNVINNFISNYVINDDILHISIDNTEITDDIILLKNTFKKNNIKLIEFKYLYNLLFNKKFKEDEKLILTDNNINEIYFKNDDYLNFKTLYEDLAENDN